MKRFLFLFVTIASCHIGSASEIIKRKVFLMGCDFELTVVAPSKIEANQHLDLAISEIQRIERLISSWDPKSQTSLINQNAGIKPVKVDLELILLIERAKAISKLTDGAFDISYASIDKVWAFDGSMKKMPSKERIENSIRLINFKNIVIDKENSTVFLKKKGMKIGFGGIGKGYAADQAKKLLQSKGVPSGIINASGDMNTWGSQPNGDPWKVAITNPMNKKRSFGLLPIERGAVVTSGNYEKFVTFNNVRYSHIIDPRTGYPSSGILSVTVFAPKAELADALATSIFVMGVESGLNRVNQLPNIECIVIDAEGHLHQSNNITINHEK